MAQNGRKVNFIINDDMSDSMKYMMENWTKPKVIDPMISRTYMPGYDMGDWLTIKGPKEIYEIVQIVEITNEPAYGHYYQDKADLYIVFKRIEIKEMPARIDAQQARDFLRWKLKDNHISYANFLKEYRPLTETEKLLYAKED